MHKIKGRCVKIINEETRTENAVPYKVIQMMMDRESLCHRIKGEVLVVKEAAMEGRQCLAIQMMTNGGKYNRIEHIVDFQIDRKPKKGVIEIYAKPLVKKRNGRPFAMFEMTEDQDGYPQPSTDVEFQLVQVKDYQNRDWKEGEIEIPVNYKAWMSQNSSGLNYRATEE